MFPYIVRKSPPDFLVIEFTILFLYLKKKMYIYILALEVRIISQMRISGEDAALEVTASFVKSTDVTYQTHSG